MRKTLYLHIGIGKTGTTALQNFLWANRGALAAKGVSYPEYGTSSGAHHLLSPFHPIRGTVLIPPHRWIPEIGRIPCRSILLSSELFLWASVESPSPMSWLRELAAAFDTRVIVYLRRQDEIIMSSYNQQVKAGLEQAPLQVDRELRTFDYDRLLRPWRSVFGQQRVIVRPYEKRQFYKGALINDFLTLLGLEATGEFIFPKSGANPRLSVAALEFKRLLNQVMTDSNRFVPVLLAFSARDEQSGKPAAILAPQTRLAIVRACAEVNSMIAKQYLNRADGQLFLDPLPDPLEEWKPVRAHFSEKAGGIARFISQREPDLMARLQTSVRQALVSDDRRAAEAAAELKPYL